MKIRILGNSVRFRLTQSEVAELCNSGRVEEKTEFEETTFYYSVSLSESTDMLSAEFTNNHIALFLPNSEGSNWATDERVGFSRDMDTSGGGKLALLLEKDYACLEPRGEDESDQYPNPKARLD